MEFIVLLALVVFGAGALMAAFQKAWPVALVAVGLFLVTLASSPWVA